MIFKVKNKATKEVAIADIPDGDHFGILGGGTVVATIDGVEYKFSVKPVVRGINIPATIRINGDDIWISTGER